MTDDPTKPEAKDGRAAPDPFNRRAGAKSNVTFRITGPVMSQTNSGNPQGWLWEADVELLEWNTAEATNWSSRSARVLFAPATGRKPAGGDATHFPGAMLIRCRVNRVVVRLGNTTFETNLGNKKVESQLVVQADKDDWNWPLALRAELKTAQCVAGEIAVPNSAFTKSTWPQYFKKILTVSKASNLSLCASGLIFEAETQLAWRKDPIPRARYIVEVKFPLPKDGTLSPLIVLPDREPRAGSDCPKAMVGYRDAFTNLEAALNTPPQVAAVARVDRLDWSRLELTDLNKCPQFYWQEDKRSATTSPPFNLRFDPGQWRLQLVDQPVGKSDFPPRGSLFVTPGVEIPFPPSASAPIVVNLTPPAAETPPPPAAGPRASYSVRASEQTWSETWNLEELQFGYRAVETAQKLRSLYNLPAPAPSTSVETTPSDALAGSGLDPQLTGQIMPQSLWAFMPLDDGWAQLPFLNVTDQLYLDILPEPQKVQGRPPLLHGGVSIGNDRPDVFDPAAGEAPWNITLANATNLRGTWTLNSSATGLASIELVLNEPVLFAEGLIWLAVHTPTADDSLPEQDNFVNATFQLPLQSHDPGNLYPSPFLLEWNEILLTARHPSESSKDQPPQPVRAALSSAKFGFSANMNEWPGSGEKIYDLLLGPKAENAPGPQFQPDLFWNTGQDTGLVWRRHAFAPFVQALPLTQSAVPPNYPSASRQLAPFELPLKTLEKAEQKYWVPDGWTFEIQSALTWPTVANGDKLRTASFWRAHLGLTLASLGLPGVTFDPHGLKTPVILGRDRDGTDVAEPPGLPASIKPQYTHGLPYLDQVHALAGLPRDDRPKVSAQVADESPPPPPPALLRSDFAEHFRKLAELAFLSAASADPALQEDPNGTQISVAHAVEPLVWPVKPKLSLSYPGVLEFDPKLRLSGEPSNAAAPLDALTGIQGEFDRKADGTLKLSTSTGAYSLVGGSMQASLDTVNHNIRDQRGLMRGDAKISKDRLIKTNVELEAKVADFKKCQLCTLRSTETLSVSTDNKWKLWFRDLPFDPSGMFRRSDVSNSDERRGANNPEASSRELAWVNGYEWRLGLEKVEGTDSPTWLPLGPLIFFPLSLDAVELNDKDELHSVIVSGRLQLPLPGGKQSEQLEHHNAVQLVFTNGKLQSMTQLGEEPDGPLASLENAPESQVLDWPLSDDFAGPVLRVNGLQFDVAGQELQWLGTLTYSSHGVVWTLPERKMKVPLAGKEVVIDYLTENTPFDALKWPYRVDHEICIESIKLILDLAVPTATGHTIAAKWAYRWDEKEKLRLSVDIKESVFPEAPVDPAEVHAQLRHLGSTLPLNLEITKSEAADISKRLDDGAVQLTWRGLKQAEDKEFVSIDLLPGMALRKPVDKDDASTMGFAMLAYAIQSQENGMPLLEATGGMFDALFQCRWGTSLQSLKSLRPADATIDGKQAIKQVESALFESSSGVVDAEYFCRRTEEKSTTWESELLLNGVIECRNLLSWPTALTPLGPDKSDNLVCLPAVRDGTPAIPFTHLRHVARVLLNQHKVPGSLLVGSRRNESMFDLNFNLKQPSGADDDQDGVWSFQATVEHQLFQVEFGADGTIDVNSLGEHDYRFTTVQEVRLCSPIAVHKFLRKFSGELSSPRRAVKAGQKLNVSRWTIAKFSVANLGLFADELLELLTDDPADGESLLESLQNVGLLVEASVTPFLRRAGAANVGDREFTGLSVLPSGTTHGVVSSATDFERPALKSAPAPEYEWALVPLPFFGRLMIRSSGPDSKASTGVDEAAAGKKSDEPSNHPFEEDPIARLRDDRRLGREPKPWSLRFAHWADKAVKPIPLAEFDLIFHRMFARLDPASVREGWFRLYIASAAKEFASSSFADSQLRASMESPPGDGPAVLGRPEVLRRVFDPRRPALPPTAAALDLLAEGLPAEKDISWQPNSLWVLSTDVPPTTLQPTTIRKTLLQYGFLGAGVLLLQAIHYKVLLPPEEPSPDLKWPAVHPAATLMPPDRELDVPRGDGKKTPNQHPQSLALSPYLRLGVVPVMPGGQFIGIVRSIDLLTFDVARRNSIIATNTSQAGSQITTATEVIGWARESHARLAADSPTAIVRVRTLSESAPTQTADTRSIRLDFSFHSVVGAIRPRFPVDRAVPVRSRPQLQRRVEATFGGLRMPKTQASTAQNSDTGVSSDFELAPPLVDGVQPIRTHFRYGAGGFPGPWPWGLSALRLSVAYRENDAGTLGRPESFKSEGGSLPRLWWQSFQHVVQYRLAAEEKSLENAGGSNSAQPPEAEIRRRKLLPINFRSEPRAADWPAWPGMILPQAEAIRSCLAPSADMVTWQPVLPGRCHVLFTGHRPGVPFLIRAQIQSHECSANLVEASGTVAVQHRLPRPVMMPRNKPERPEIALQTIPGIFDIAPNQTVGVHFMPMDNAYAAPRIAESGGKVTLVNSSPVAVAVAKDARAFVKVAAGFVEVLIAADVVVPANGQIEVGVVPVTPGDIPATSTGRLAESPDITIINPDVKGGSPPPGLGLELQAQAAPLRPATGVLRITLTSTSLESIGIGRRFTPKSNPKKPQYYVSGKAKLLSAAEKLYAVPIESSPAKTDETWDLGLPPGQDWEAVGNAETNIASIENPQAVGWWFLEEPVIQLDQLDSDAPLRFAIRARQRSADGKSEPKIAEWFRPNSVSLTDGESSFAFTKPDWKDPDIWMTELVLPTEDENQAKALSSFNEWLQSRPHGQLVWLRVLAGLDPQDEKGVKNFLETLVLPFRISRSSEVFRVPLRPRFISFEDPEYNRRLSSTTASKSKMVPQTGGESLQFTLAADRREYNPSGAIYYLFYTPDGKPPEKQYHMRFSKLLPSGVATMSTTFVKMETSVLPDLKYLMVESFEFAESLKPGDILRLSLCQGDVPADPEKIEIELDLHIVRDPVTPMPEAAYALLRMKRTVERADAELPQVECVRFAWGPNAMRVELLDPNDLLRETVRRRALFRWSDTPRRSHSLASNSGGDVEVRYAIQRINTFGSTHLPLE